jgi:hypothetical protein
VSPSFLHQEFYSESQRFFGWEVFGFWLLAVGFLMWEALEGKRIAEGKRIVEGKNC